MRISQRLAGVLFIVALATFGYVVISILPRLVEEYQKAAAFHPVWGYIYAGVAIFVGLTFASLAVWTLVWLAGNSAAKARRRREQGRNPSQMTLREREAEIKEHLTEVQALAGDAALPPELRQPIEHSLGTLKDKIEQETLEIVAFGTVSSGKSSLLNALAGREVFQTDPRGGTTHTRAEVPWPGADRVVLVDTPGLAEIDGHQREELTRHVARDADLVLVVLDGPVRDFEMQLIEQLRHMEKPLVVCLNKEDWYRADDRDLLLGQISQQLAQVVPQKNIVAVRAQPIARTRVRVLADGSEVEEGAVSDADIAPLAERMLAVVRRDGRDILLANLLLRSRGLVQDARQQVLAALDERANSLVERSMWQAGGAAALSPLPVLDVAASLAISSKMVLELARIYRQPMDLQTATRLIGELGKNLVSILGATAATPLVGTAVASLLKTVPGVGTIAGGVLQGLVQALVTRWIGRVFIAYFRTERDQAGQSLAMIARAKWEQVTESSELLELVRAGMSRLGAKQG